jgi:hypothetical protein
MNYYSITSLKIIIKPVICLFDGLNYGYSQMTLLENRSHPLSCEGFLLGLFSSSLHSAP